MSIARLKRRAAVFGTCLAGAGFAPDSAYRFRRRRANIDQFVEIQPASKSVGAVFACNLAWAFTVPSSNESGTYDYLVRLGNVCGLGDHWYRYEGDELERSFGLLRLHLETCGLPFLASVDSLPKLFAAYENAEHQAGDVKNVQPNPVQFFGVDEGWKQFNMGFGKLAGGDSQGARKHLEAVVDHHSDAPFHWVMKRKETCLKALVELAPLS